MRVRTRPPTPFQLTVAVLVVAALAALCLAAAAVVGSQVPAPADPPGRVPVAGAGTSSPRPPHPPLPGYDVGRPTRVVVPALDVDEPLGPVGLQPDGAMEMPDFGDAAWYDRGPRPGRPGGAVVVAHVHGPAGPDLFARLGSLRPGDAITVHGTRRATTFVVTAVQDVPKEQLPYARIWPETPRPLLRLITCGGERTPTGYPENTVVYAEPA